MRIIPYITAKSVFAFAAGICRQALNAPIPQPAHITGTVTDTNGDIMPGATVAIDGGPGNRQTAVANDNGAFEIDNITPGTAYQVKVTADGLSRFRRLVSTSPISANYGAFSKGSTSVRAKYPLPGQDRDVSQRADTSSSSASLPTHHRSAR